MNLPPIVVYGDTAPQGSKNRNRYGAVYESSKKVKPWREAVKAAAMDVLDAGSWDRPALVGPLAVSLVLTRKRPQGLPKKRRVEGNLIPIVHYPGTQPDVDKLARAVLDALKDAGVYGNDGQVVALLAVKAYPNEWPDALGIPGAVIRVRPMEVFLAELTIAFRT